MSNKGIKNKKGYYDDVSLIEIQISATRETCAAVNCFSKYDRASYRWGI